MSQTEYVILVDENDQEIGLEEKVEAHRRALRHRAFSIIIFRPGKHDLEVLLQRRAHDKYHCGGLWTNTCCSHPRHKEDVLQAARRRLLEEMGFSTDLYYAGKFHYISRLDSGLTENEIDHVILGAHREDSPAYNPKEVAEVKWFALSAVKEWMAKNSEEFTPWFPRALELALAKKEIIKKAISHSCFSDT